MISLQEPSLLIDTEPMSSLVTRLTRRMEELWYSTPSTFPELSQVCTPGRQRACEKELSRLLNALDYGLKRAPANEEGRAALRQRILDETFNFIQSAFGFEPRHLDVVRRSRLVELVEQFAAMARRYDPRLSSEDIYQASRNVSSMNLMQLLLGLPIEVTPAVFAYSMLYPYTDNYLDDPAISMETKHSFNLRFYNLLAGDAAAAQSAQEERIWDLVHQVEIQFPRPAHPQVYESLLAIHSAQSRSLRLLRAGSAPYEVDVLGLSFEKGGASVLADGFLVAGSLTEDQAAFMFGFGSFTQLMDDLEDVENDRQAGCMTIFSQTAGRYPLDSLTNRLFHLGKRIFTLQDIFTVPDAAPLQAMSLRAINPLLYFSVANFSHYYTRPYLKRLESAMPLRIGYLRSQRKKFERSRASLVRLAEGG